MGELGEAVRPDPAVLRVMVEPHPPLYPGAAKDVELEVAVGEGVLDHPHCLDSRDAKSDAIPQRLVERNRRALPALDVASRQLPHIGEQSLRWTPQGQDAAPTR